MKQQVRELLECRKYSSSTLMAKSKEFLVKVLMHSFTVSDIDVKLMLSDLQSRFESSFDYIKKENAHLHRNS